VANLLNEGRITRERARVILNSAYFSGQDWDTRQTLADILYRHFQPQAETQPETLIPRSEDLNYRTADGLLVSEAELEELTAPEVQS
jgi:serine protease inhibitor